MTDEERIRQISREEAEKLLEPIKEATITRAKVWQHFHKEVSRMISQLREIDEDD